MDSARVVAAGQNVGKLLVQGMTSCALAEISGLVNYADAPERAMRDFYLGSRFEQAVIMIFHGVVKWTGVGPIPTNERWVNGGQYTQQFAAYITANKLGELKEGVETANIRYHSQHVIRVYTWTPDYPAIEKWYRETGSKVKDPEKRVVLVG